MSIYGYMWVFNRSPPDSNPSHTQIRSYQLTEELTYCEAVWENIRLPQDSLQCVVHKHVCFL